MVCLGLVPIDDPKDEDEIFMNYYYQLFLLFIKTDLANGVRNIVVLQRIGVRIL